MLDLATELTHLTIADHHIAEGEEPIRHQAELVERLRAGQHDTRKAERFLGLLRDTLQNWRVHREEIVRTIARLRTSML